MEADFDIRALYRALDEARTNRELSWAQVAREVNARFAEVAVRVVSASTITGTRTRALVEADGVLQMLRWLDRSPESFVPGHPLAAAAIARLPGVEPNRILRFDTKAMYDALDRRRVERGLTWSGVAEEIGGIRAAGLTRLGEGGRTTFPQVMRIVRWLERPAAAFTRASEW